MQALLGAAPLVVACVLLALRVGPVRSAMTAVVCAVVMAVFVFPVPAVTIWATAGSLGPTTVEVLVILLGGVVLSELLSRSGAQRQLASWLQRCCADPGRAVLLVVLGITPFAESVTGFGVGVVVAVPLLRHLGFPAAQSAILGLLGLVIVPWGALAPGTLVAAQLGGVGFDALGARSAALSGVVFLVIGAAALVVARGRRRALTHLPDLLVVAGVLWAAVWAANRVLGTPLAGVAGGLAGILAALALSRWRDQVRLRIDGDTWRALAPYTLLVIGLLLSSLLVRVTGATGAWSLAASPATWLVLTCLASPPLLALRRDGIRPAVGTGLRRWAPIAAATALFLVLGGVLTATGMSAALAQAASRLGPTYLVLVPLIGGLGGFIAGSNTGANAMFAASQAQAAAVLGVSRLHVLATQNVSASLLTMATPPRVALAATLATAQAPTQQASIPAGGFGATGSLAPPSSAGPVSDPSAAAGGAGAAVTVTAAVTEHERTSTGVIAAPGSAAESVAEPPRTRTVMHAVLAADAVAVAVLAVLSVVLT